MRLDKFLKVSRIIKRRTLAYEASSEVKIGDTISIRFGEKLTTLKVNSILENPKKDETMQMYELQ